MESFVLRSGRHPSNSRHTRWTDSWGKASCGDHQRPHDTTQLRFRFLHRRSSQVAVECGTQCAASAWHPADRGCTTRAEQRRVRSPKARRRRQTRLRDCALPSCSKTEKTVSEFKLCAECRLQVYCCLEHQALDWKAHKKACEEKEAARRAEEKADDEGTGGGSAAA